MNREKHRKLQLMQEYANYLTEVEAAIGSASLRANCLAVMEAP